MMSEPQHTPSPDEAEGLASARPRLSRRGWVLAIAGVVALTGIVGWFALAKSNPPVRWQDVGFVVESPTQVQVTFDAHLYSDASVVCHVRALSVSYAEVGVAQTTVDPADGASQRITLDIATVEEATSAQVNYCEVER